MSDSVTEPSEGKIPDHGIVLSQINDAMGQPENLEVLLNQKITPELMQSDVYQTYLCDESYMWAIRTFLVNATFNGEISDERYNQILSTVTTPKGRENIAASLMLLPVLSANKLEFLSEVSS